ncbi:MAG: 50S ribosomal protein L11 methyltransferase [Rickettsiaceae bacterium]|nr:50S ribosomal protein L11 methyltransferase [Rickettsiaceae bacterium]
MNSEIGQLHIIHQITFYSTYEDLKLYEEFFSDYPQTITLENAQKDNTNKINNTKFTKSENITSSNNINKFSLLDYVLGISSHEIVSDSIDALPDDIWQIDILLSQQVDLDILYLELTRYSEQHNIRFIGLRIILLEEQDWVATYQAKVKPLFIESFIIASKEAKFELIEGKIPIYIEASRAFGTGDHATTSLCIKAISTLRDLNIDKVFDIGTGSGILSFAAEKIWNSAKILACDIDETSVKIAHENKITNNSNVEFYQNSEQDLSIPTGWSERFDLIIANILAMPLIHLASTIRNLVYRGSYVILSGFLDYQIHDVAKAYQAQGFNIYKTLQEDKWVCLILFLP